MSSKHTAKGQLQLGLAVAPIQRCVSVARVEVFVPADLPGLPVFLTRAFENRLHDLDCQCETVSVYGADLPRDLRAEEVAALAMAKQRYDIDHRILKR